MNITHPGQQAIVYFSLFIELFDLFLFVSLNSVTSQFNLIYF